MFTRNEFVAICHSLTWTTDVPFSVILKPTFASADIDLMHALHDRVLALLEVSNTVEIDKAQCHCDFSVAELSIIYISLTLFIAEIGYNNQECLTVTGNTAAQILDLITKVRYEKLHAAQ